MALLPKYPLLSYSGFTKHLRKNRKTLYLAEQLNFEKNFRPRFLLKKAFLTKLISAFNKTGLISNQNQCPHGRFDSFT